MGGSSSSQVVGYKYYLGVHQGVCHGPVDKIITIYVDNRRAWPLLAESAIEYPGGTAVVAASDLFGGDKREGGVSGDVSFLFGAPDQGTSSYLSTQLGDDVPAFRGVLSVVNEQTYMGNNPYLKPWAFQVSRIHLKANGETQWYDAKAQIGRRSFSVSDETGCLPYACDAYSLAAAQAEYYWPCDNDPAVDGYLAGTVNLTVGAGFELMDGPLIDGGCDEFDHWREAASSGQVDADGSDGINTVGPDFNFFKVWRRDGTGLNRTIQQCVLYWVNVNRIANTMSLSLKTEGSDIVFSWVGVGNDTRSGSERYTNAIPNASTEAHMLGYSVSGLPDSFTAGGVASSYFSGTVTVYADGETLGSFEIRLPNRISGGSASGEYPYSYADFTSAFAGGHASRYSDILYNGNISLLLSEWERNQSGYTPPDECFTTGDCGDMNPAHIIRECLTEPWGLGYTDADIDEAAFTAAADTLYDEYMGISLLWDREVELEEFIGTILSHIDAVLYVSRDTGKFVLKLIRDDYDVDNLITLDETNSRLAKDAKRPTIGELTTSVTVKFTDSEAEEEDGSVTVHNEALIQLQGAERNASREYPGFMARPLASRVALRDLKQLSTPLLSAEIECSRVASSLNIGDPFKANYPEQGIYSVVMRVQQMSLGDGRDNTIKISALEDVFSVPNFADAPVDNSGGDWTDPTEDEPLASDPRLVIEAPYLEVVQRLGELDTEAIINDENDAGFLLVAGGRQANELNADLLTDSGAGYSDNGTLDFAPYCYLVDSIGKTDTTIYYTAGKDLDIVTMGSVAQIDDEIIRVDAFGTDSNGAYMEVGRGCLDTVPADHTIDSNGPFIIFFDEFPATDEVQYTASDTVDVKLLTWLASNRLSEAAAPEDTVVFDSRAYRPYPPANLKVETLYYPENHIFESGDTITWNHRDRLLQTAIGVTLDDTDDGVGPEPGTTYRVDLHEVNPDGTVGDLVHTDTTASNSYTFDADSSGLFGSAAVTTDKVQVSVTSLRDGYESWQSPAVVMYYGVDSNDIGS